MAPNFESVWKCGVRPGQHKRLRVQAVVGYSKSLEKAKEDPRVQGNPPVIRASFTSGTSAADMVVSNADAGKIARADGTAGLLGNCRVMFILD